ncbi:ATP-binding protein [Asticcacaulis currens]|uniref:Histidine kinase n=1 Tax=Asticcacaulis currens TaxID=2984210 RepID=A0ABT5IE28_9CAUL|nr:ATP-binding protein [Asticcacaulis currens]MDC7694409.1 histidine kinase [Asticcacaulis currens]
MESASPLLTTQIETVAELRELYRAAEARAARLRLLSQAGGELALAEMTNVESVLQTCAGRLAHFLGRGRASIAPQGPGLGLRAPGQSEGAPPAPFAYVSIDGFTDLSDIPDAEDREAVRLVLELMGATASRIEREAERGRLTATLREREQRLEYVLGRLFTAQEDERRRLSHELHDGVAQTATALVRLLEGGTDRAHEPVAGPQRVRLAQIARELVQEIRAIIGGLRPTLLDDLGLSAALRYLAEEMEKAGYSVTLVLPEETPILPSAVETALFRVAQEAVTNIRKHAGGPCPVTVSLTMDAPTGITLRISDRGRGITPAETALRADRQGMQVGREVMHERMLAIGGDLLWEAKPEGVCVTAHLPHLPLPPSS